MSTRHARQSTTTMPGCCRKKSWPITGSFVAKRLELLILVLLLIGLPSWAQAQGTLTTGPPDPQELEIFLDQFFAEQMQKVHIPGAAFVLVKDGEIFFTKGYGYANLEKKTPVIPDKTVFRVGSVSKLLTATAVMQLYERGKLKLDVDVNEYLQLFKLQNNYSKPVTVANLLTHTGGFDDRNIGTAALSESTLMPLGPYLAQRMPPRVMLPGEVISYSNHGFALAGYLVEVISNMAFAQYIDENILQPLGMNHSSFLQPPHPAADLAMGYVYKNGAYQQVPLDYLNTAPAGSLITTATDIARFMIAHLQNGRYENVHILKEATAQEMHRQHFTHHPQLPGIAYSFIERFQNKLRAIEHDGAVRGFRSSLFLLPDQNLGFFLAFNNFGFGPEMDLPEQFIKQFLDRYYPVREKAGPPQPLAGLRSRVNDFTGTYRLNRYARHTLDKLAVLAGMVPEVRVMATAEGTLAIGSEQQYVAIEPFLFRQVDDERYMAFREDRQGRITQLFIGWAAFDKLAWYETASFQLSLLGFSVLVFLWVCVVWIVGLLMGRWRKQSIPTVRSVKQARLLAGLLSALNLVFLIGFALASLQMDPLEFNYSVPAVLIGLLVIPVLAAVLTVGLLVFTGVAWKNAYWSVSWRMHYSLVTLAALVFMWWLNYWNLLGFHF